MGDAPPFGLTRPPATSTVHRLQCGRAAPHHHSQHCALAMHKNPHIECAAHGDATCCSRTDDELRAATAENGRNCSILRRADELNGAR